jgi:hypothetical protein
MMRVKVDEDLPAALTQLLRGNLLFKSSIKSMACDMRRIDGA